MSLIAFPMSIITTVQGPCSAEHHTRGLVFPARAAAALAESVLAAARRSRSSFAMSLVSAAGGSEPWRTADVLVAAAAARCWPSAQLFVAAPVRQGRKART